MDLYAPLRRPSAFPTLRPDMTRLLLSCLLLFVSTHTVSVRSPTPVSSPAPARPHACCPLQSCAFTQSSSCSLTVSVCKRRACADFHVRAAVRLLSSIVGNLSSVPVPPSDAVLRSLRAEDRLLHQLPQRLPLVVARLSDIFPRVSQTLAGRHQPGAAVHVRHRAHRRLWRRLQNLLSHQGALPLQVAGRCQQMRRLCSSPRPTSHLRGSGSLSRCLKS